MKKLLLLFLFCCACAAPELKFPDAKVVIPVTVHTINNHYANFIAPTILNTANEEFRGMVGFDPIIEVRKDIPTEFDTVNNHMVIENQGRVHIFIFMGVATVTKNGWGPVAGAYEENEFRDCSGYIVLNGSSMRDDTLAHEFGHLFGLEHILKDDNIMYHKRIWDSHFDDRQLVKMYNKALKLKEKCYDG